MRGCAKEFRESVSDETWYKKLNQCYFGMCQAIMSRNPRCNAWALVFGCAIESWRVSWSESSRLQALSMLPSAPTLFQFIKRNGKAWRRWHRVWPFLLFFRSYSALFMVDYFAVRL